MSDNLEVGASSREIIKDKLRQNFDGKIAIPSVMTYEGKDYPVTALREGVFAGSDTANKNAVTG